LKDWSIVSVSSVKQFNKFFIMKTCVGYFISSKHDTISRLKQ
jgi:hypothetical protein